MNITKRGFGALLSGAMLIGMVVAAIVLASHPAEASPRLVVTSPREYISVDLDEIPDPVLSCLQSRGFRAESDEAPTMIVIAGTYCGVTFE